MKLKPELNYDKIELFHSSLLFLRHMKYIFLTQNQFGNITTQT